VAGWVLALGSTCQAEKTAVISCMKASDGTIRYEKQDFEASAKQFAIADPRFYKIDQFRKLKGPDSRGNIRGTCIVDFMSEDEFNMYYRN
jgi:hypothetical protein